MASPSTSTPSAAPYPEFHWQGPRILPNWTSEGEGALRDHDGAVLQETEWSSLRDAIIKRNDAVLLRRYLALHPSSLGPGETPPEDPFWIAAAHGSIDVLEVMLQHWAANTSTILAPDARGFRLLQVACAHAQLATVRFLVDESRPHASRFGNAQAITKERDSHGYTAILSAASRFHPGRHFENDNDSEELMRLLLSKGARATDAVFPPADTEPLVPFTVVVDLPSVDQPLHTVLSLAASGASAGTIGCLVEGGAHVHDKTIYVDDEGLFGQCEAAWDVTPLHIGSMFANSSAIQALRDHRGDGVEWRDMVASRDSHGRLPLHWAAGGPWAETNAAIDGILHTMELLLLADNAADTVSSPDAQGDTPLHYAISNASSRFGDDEPEKNYWVAKFLCEKGARASTHGANGQTPLHRLISKHALRPTTSMMAVAKLLLEHGADVGDADDEGNTVLHLVARSPRHLETVRFLLDEAGAGNGGKGARDRLLLHAVNGQGNTPLHMAASAQSYYIQCQSVEERIQLQDAMMRALTPECRADGLGENDGEKSLLDQPNQAGKTPKQLCEQTRCVWRQQQQDMERARTTGFGRGRGRGRGGGGNPVAPSIHDSPW